MLLIEYGKRIYFDKNTHKIIFETSDRQGLEEYVFDSVDWDFENTMLKNYKRDDIGYIQLEYMEIFKLMEEHNANAYRLNDNNELEFYTIEYPPSPEELKEREIEDLKDKVKQLENDKIELSKAAAELYEKSESDKLELSKAIAEIYEATVGAE